LVRDKTYLNKNLNLGNKIASHLITAKASRNTDQTTKINKVNPNKEKSLVLCHILSTYSYTKMKEYLFLETPVSMKLNDFFEAQKNL
jgi:hypothetical protein